MGIGPDVLGTRALASYICVHAGANTREDRGIDVVAEALKAKIDALPTTPGCYLMKDDKGVVFYIGKAGNLRSRVKSYFSGSDQRQFVAWLDQLLADLDFVLVDTEKEALLLERTMVQEQKPRFNVLLKDDKNFIHLRLAPVVADASAKKRKRYPRVAVVRNPKDDGARYFGPYHSASSVRQALRIVSRHFQLRTCSDSVLENRKRACLQYQIGRCPAPCIQEVDDYGEHADDAAMFLAGKPHDLVEGQLKPRMWHAAEQQHFEHAARLRDQISAIQTTMDTQVVTEVTRRKNQDVIAAVRSGPYLEVARLVVRGGRMLRSESFPFERQEFPTGELVASFLFQLYDSMSLGDLPDEVLVNLDANADFDALRAVLTERKGKRVTVRQPARGALRRLVGIGEMNADAQLKERLKKSDTRQRAMDGLTRRLRLKKPPRVIECFDVSLFQGVDAVASKVCFVDGAPEKARYRRYRIKTVDGTDDFLMMHEVLSRRLARTSGDDALPDLLLVDGGKGQLKMAETVCQDLGIKTGPDAMMLAAIAKSRLLDDDKSAARQKGVGFELEMERSFERLFIPGAKDPLHLKPHTHERHLIEQIRDEAHRFAITYHRRERKKRTLRSDLDDVPGVGPALRKAILKQLGSMTGVKNASVEELGAVKGVGPKLARTIHAQFQDTILPTSSTPKSDEAGDETPNTDTDPRDAPGRR